MPNITQKRCEKCGVTKPLNRFYEILNPFFPDGHLSICGECIEQFVTTNHANVEALDKLCQWIDIKFDLDMWHKIWEVHKEKSMEQYLKPFLHSSYSEKDWRTTSKKYEEIIAAQEEEEHIKCLYEGKMDMLRKKWGRSYDEEDLIHLEELFQGILVSQNVNGEIPLDNAKKLCRISLAIDDRILAGEDFKDELASYEKLIKVAEFTPKNAKDANNFTSIGEVFAYLERTGWENHFYDWVERDVVDTTMKNIQMHNRKLYTEESGIGEEIERRIEGLKIAQQQEEDEFGNYSEDEMIQHEAENYVVDFDEDFEEEIT